MKQRYLAVIPARYKSSRFEGKPLVMIQNKPMIMWVYDAVCESKLFDRVVVATDDDRILSCVEKYGGYCVMTSSDLRNGTERVAQTVNILEQSSKNEYFDVVINVQGDEPLIKKEMMSQIIRGFERDDTQIVTLKKVISKKEDINDSNVVKVVTSNDKVLYFSRSIVPFNRDVSLEELMDERIYFKHIGIYGYKTEILKRIVQLQESKLEKVEKLEQLRWLENGYDIIAMTTQYDSIGVDTIEDWKRVEDLVSSRSR